jgi:hypothetical protein
MTDLAERLRVAAANKSLAIDDARNIIKEAVDEIERLRKFTVNRPPTSGLSFKELVQENQLLRIAAGFTEIKTHG